MKHLSLLWFILSSFIAQPVWAKSIEMNKTAFDSLTASGIWFVEHFSPYCHFCIDFAPTWKDLAEEEDGLASTHGINFGTIDCSIHSDLCSEHGITGYPKMILYVNGNYAQTYLDARSKESIKAYLKQEHRKWTKAMSTHDQKTTTTTPTLPTISDVGSMVAITGSAHGDGRWMNPVKSVLPQFNSSTVQDLLDDQRMMILGAYGNEDELFHNQFRNLFEKANDVAAFVEIDLDTNGDVARKVYNIQKTKILIVDGKNKLYYDRDIHSNLLDIQQPQHILQTLDDVIAGNLKGIPIGRLEHHTHNGYSLLRWHDYFTLVVFAFLVAVVNKATSRKRKTSATTTTNSTNSYINNLSKLV